MRVSEGTPAPTEASPDNDPKGAALAALMGKRLVKMVLVIAGLGLIAAIISIALSNFDRMRTGAMEAQTKSNLHTIQIALERYAVDWENLYPSFLLGGSLENNPMTPGKILKAFKVADIRYEMKGGMNRPTKVGEIRYELQGPPFAFQYERRRRSEMPPAGQPRRFRHVNGYCKGDEGALCGDALLIQGYLAEYPRNPFEPEAAARLGDHTRMIELSLGWGDAILMELNLPSDSSWRTLPLYPGNFFYHPYYCDGLEVAKHNAAQVNYRIWEEGWTGRIVTSICGYTLVAFGAPTLSGVDFTHQVKWKVTSEYMKTVCSTYICPERDPEVAIYLSGYMSYEPDPYGYLQARDEIGPTGSGPDGIPDHAILMLWGGLDRKVTTIPPLTDSGEPETQ